MPSTSRIQAIAEDVPIANLYNAVNSRLLCCQVRKVLPVRAP
ncbi:MAG TPA: hypothetical protein VKS22_14730 [Candidatus Binataceae bacterium]|nr:hypothetical protein [Candidatus Binataceae bacterium]